jgi:hypothetical protein
VAAGGEEGFQIYFSDVLGATSPVRHIIYKEREREREREINFCSQ